MTARAPIAGGRLWRQVIDRAGGFCQCQGTCGRRHVRTGGRCAVGQAAFPPVPLYVAPTDPALPVQRTWQVSTDQLAAWCGQCLDDAHRRHHTTTASTESPAAGTGDLLALIDPATAPTT